MFGILKDVVDIATAPIKIVADASRVITKPAADMANELVDEVEDFVDDIVD